MKKLLITALISISFNAFSKDIYCEIVARETMTRSLVISVDYGDKSMYDDRRIKDENNEKIKFLSIVECLNYMIENGWEYVDTYVIPRGNYGEMHYIMKRKDDKE